ncbi:MAG: M28 family peptidase [Chitinophagaceae bacterium]|nr:MAG: M28 family peptidase [Chitinophagaceae bacterium]
MLPLLLLGASAFAQVDDAAKYAGIIRTSELQKHLTIIAADDMEGRETGTRGQRKAAAYIENFFKTTGLASPAALKGYQQLYPLYQDSMISSSFKIGDKEAIYGTDYISPVNNNESIKAKSKSLVFVGYGIDDPAYNDYAGLDVKGKVVVFFLGEPKKDGKYFIDTKNARGSAWTFPGLSKKLELAMQKGAKAAIVINPTTESFTTRAADAAKKTNVYYPRAANGKKVNYVQVSHAFAKSLMGDAFSAAITKAKSNTAFESADRMEKKAKMNLAYKKYRTTINASNVLGVIEGTDKKDEFVFITAHYDHIGISPNGQINNGADDDGSGTVSVMQIGEAFVKAKAEGKGPRRTVVIMTVSGEEKGLWGSEYYSDNPVFPLEKTTVDLNIDMIGRVDTERMMDDTLNYVYVVGHNKLSSDLPIINEGMNKKYTGLVLDYKFDDPKDPNRIYFRSDHYNFARKGVPVLFFYDGMLKSDYHKPGDDVEKINFALMEKRARMVFHTAWEMANRNEMLKRDIPLSNETR